MDIKNPSFIITGASASGKSTLVRESIEAGYCYSPTHMTRGIREDEVDGIDGVFLTRKQFESNFQDGQYLEPSLDYAELKPISVYYDTPASWTEILNNPGNCASPVALKMARKLLEAVDVRWVHLVCDDSDKYNRLRERGYSGAEIYARMTSGEPVAIPPEATVMNSSDLRSKEILHNIMKIQ